MSARATITFFTPHDSREVVRKRRFPVRCIEDLIALVHLVQREKTSGTMQINFSSGGRLENASFEERARIPS